MHIILVPGLWLDGSVWQTVDEHLRERGHTVTSVTLPGQGTPEDQEHGEVTLQDHLDAVVNAVDAGGDPVILVGHSAASTLVWLAADRRVERVSRVMMVGGFPGADGSEYANFFDIVDAVMAFPGWEAFDGPDSDDLAAQQKDRLATDAVPVPESVATGIVRYESSARQGIPVTLVCPEYSPNDARSWIAAGDIPELEAVRTVEYEDIDSGHWPMITRPRELADIIIRAADTEHDA